MGRHDLDPVQNQALSACQGAQIQLAALKLWRVGLARHSLAGPRSGRFRGLSQETTMA